MMPVGYKKIAVIFFLHPHIITHGAKIIAQVQKTSRPYPAYDDFFLLLHKAAKIVWRMENGVE
jgi:hypothetical protein